MLAIRTEASSPAAMYFNTGCVRGPLRVRSSHKGSGGPVSALPPEQTNLKERKNYEKLQNPFLVSLPLEWGVECSLELPPCPRAGRKH